MDGCLDTFAKSIEGNKDIVVTVSGGMILGMVIIFGLLFYQDLLTGERRLEEDTNNLID